MLDKIILSRLPRHHRMSLVLSIAQIPNGPSFTSTNLSQELALSNSMPPKTMYDDEKRALRDAKELAACREQDAASPIDAKTQPQMLQDALDLSAFRAKKIVGLNATVGHRDAEILQLKKACFALEAQVAQLTGNINPTARAILLSGFKQPPAFKAVLRKICDGQVYCIQRFSVKKGDGTADHFVIVAFIKATAAYAFMKQYPELTVGDDLISVIYETVPKHFPAFVAKRALGFPINPDVIDHPGQFTRIIAIWKPKALFPKDYVELVEQGHIFESKYKLTTTIPQEVLGYRTPSDREYARLMGFSSFNPDQVVEVDQIIRRRKPGTPFDSHVGLKIEYTSIEACLKAFKEMKEDENLKDCLYEVLQDYCETGKPVHVKGPSHAHSFGYFSPASSPPEWCVTPDEDVRNQLSLPPPPRPYRPRVPGIIQQNSFHSSPAKGPAIASGIHRQPTPAPTANTYTALGESWECPDCGYNNFSLRDICRACGKPRAAASTVTELSNRATKKAFFDDEPIARNPSSSPRLQRNFDQVKNKLRPFNNRPASNGPPPLASQLATSSMPTQQCYPPTPADEEGPVSDIPPKPLDDEFWLIKLDDTPPASPVAKAQPEDKRTDMERFLGIKKDSEADRQKKQVRLEDVPMVDDDKE
ncbi:hypothetical protein BDV96DRAFT_689584 [Lophiotrema nucula]|uniref:RanBP2-type domain-containing protein n=1 Tax=Lophiotrema nucula TaxID=690887 RepID=A0A6A5YYL1_9PLEO|nr:hypothetical protein BDV96DRAFT_689584 [Lophiotrema nucula]